MRRKILASAFAAVMAVVLSFSSSGLTVIAGTEEDNANSMRGAEISSEEMAVETLDEVPANVVEREYSGEAYTLKKSADTFRTSTYRSNSVSNTDPNYAYLVSNDTIMQGNIETAYEMRWYAFSLTEKSKVTISLQMIQALDADLYMFVLNEETYELELIGGSANAGFGVSEYFNDILSAGTYYFAVSGYEGTGAFAFAYYQSTADVENEVNDTSATATPVTFDNNITGVIDNPNDVDYYELTVTDPTVLKYSMSKTSDYVLQYAGKFGINAAAYTVDGNMIRVLPGTYYFAVYSPNGNYNSNTVYTANFKFIGNVTDDSKAYYMAVSEDAGIVYQSDANGQNCYVNGNVIDFNYSYFKSLSNSAGSQKYDIKITPRSDLHVTMYQSETRPIPDVAYYHGSTFTSYSGPVLTLSIYSIDYPCYSIHNVCSGAYSGNTFWEDLHFVDVFINPNTGKVVDIEWFNYFYEVGTHRITYYRPYSMKYYYPYWNGQYPVNGDAS